MHNSNDTPTVEEFRKFASGRFAGEKPGSTNGDSLSAYIDNISLIPFLANYRVNNTRRIYIAMAYRTQTRTDADKFAADAQALCQQRRITHLKIRIRMQDYTYWVMIFPTDRPSVPAAVVTPGERPSILNFAIADQFLELHDSYQFLVKTMSVLVDHHDTQKSNGV